MPLNIIANVDDDQQAGLIRDFLNDIPATVPQFVRGDRRIAVSVRPVVKSISNERPYDDDFLETDVLRLAIGNADQTASAGTFALSVGGQDTNLTAIPYNVSDAALQAPLSAASLAGGHPLLAVTLLSSGTYQVDGISNGFVPAIVADASALKPSCYIVVSQIVAGDVNAKAQQIISIRQNPVAYTNFQTPIQSSSINNPTQIESDGHGLKTGDTVAILGHAGSTPDINGKHVVTRIDLDHFTIPVDVTVAGVGGAFCKIFPDATASADITQASSPTQNRIYTVSFTPESYGGGIQVTLLANGVSASCGIASPLMSADAFSRLLANHPQVSYQAISGAPDNILVTKIENAFVIEFRGTLSGSSLLKTISTSSVANPSVIQTSAPHKYATGDTVIIDGHTGSTPDINGSHVITVIDDIHFSIPIDVTVGGTGGTVFNSTEQQLSLSNSTLLAPKGVMGAFDLNTANLARQFDQSSAQELSFMFSIEREREDGEIKTILLMQVTLRRDIIDLTTLVAIAIIDPDQRYAPKYITDGDGSGNRWILVVNAGVIGLALA